MSFKTPYSNPYDLSDEDENRIQNVEVQDRGLPRGATINMNMKKTSPWANPYNLPADFNDEILRTVAADPGVHRGTTYSAQGDDLGTDDPFKQFGAKAAASIWRRVQMQPGAMRTEFLRQVLHKLSPDLWTTVDQAANYQRAQGRNAQDALRIGLEKALSQQMVQDLMSSGWKQAAVGLAGLGACCDGCAGGREGLGWSIGGAISSVGSGIASAGGAVASAAKEVASYACSAVNSPLARPAANYGAYAYGGTAGSAGAVKGLETAQKICGSGGAAQPTQNVTVQKQNRPLAYRPPTYQAPASKLPVVPILAVGGLIAFFMLKK